MKKPCLQWPKQPTRSLLGRDPPRAYLRSGPKRASRSCILQRETVLGDQTSAPMRLGSGSWRWSSSHLTLCSPEGQGGLGCLWLRGHHCLAGGVCSLKPTPNLFSFVEKADLA